MGSRSPICDLRQPCRTSNRDYLQCVSYHSQQSPNGITGLRADTQPVLRSAHIELDVLLFPVAGLGADGCLWDGVVGSEDFEGFGVARGAAVGLAIDLLVCVSQGSIPGVGEDNVVARVVFPATTGRGRASEAEFEDHVGEYGGFVRYHLSGTAVRDAAMAMGSSRYNLRAIRRSQL